MTLEDTTHKTETAQLLSLLLKVGVDYLDELLIIIFRYFIPDHICTVTNITFAQRSARKTILVATTSVSIAP